MAAGFQHQTIECDLNPIFWIARQLLWKAWSGRIRELVFIASAQAVVE
jgi:hypothetical protein